MAKWQIGKINSTVVSDEVVINTNFPVPPNPAFSPAEDVEYYGGYLVCESIANAQNAKLIASAPEMFEILNKLNDFTDSSQLQIIFNRVEEFFNEFEK